MLLAALIAVLIGLSLGLLGGGGSILTVPLFVHVLGIPSKEAIATSLLVVGVTSAAAAVPHARAGNVRWKTAALFGGTAMAGAFVGGAVARFVPGSVLLILFALIMLAAAVAMWRGRKEEEGEHRSEGPGSALGYVVLEGVGVGFVTGLVGAGGGFLVVPALALLGGLPMRAAIGTSLVVIALKSAAGFLGYVSHVSVQYELAAVVTAGAVLGSVAGSILAARVPAAKLRKAFSVLVLTMGAFLLYQEIAPRVGEWTPGAAGVVLGLVVITATVLAAIGYHRARTQRRIRLELTSSRHPAAEVGVTWRSRPSSMSGLVRSPTSSSTLNRGMPSSSIR